MEEQPETTLSPSEGVVVHGSAESADRSAGVSASHSACRSSASAEREVRASEPPAALIWCETYTGIAVDLLEPDPATIRRDDIVHHLCHINRFSGATISPYSVAQHSIWVSHAVERLGGRTEAQLWGLLHDAHEAYIGDITRPVRQAMAAMTGLGFTHAIDQITQRLDRAIQAWAGIEVARPDLLRVQEADSLALRYEATHLMFTGGKAWSLPPNLTCVPLGEKPVVLKPNEVERRFIERLVELTRGKSLK